MNEEKSAGEKSPLEECARQLSDAAGALERVIGKLEAQYEALNQKIDRIIATVEKMAGEKSGEEEVKASAEMNRLQEENRELRQRAGRKTVAPLVNRLLAKSGVGEGVQVEAGALDKALGGLTIEQRMAVKSELARAGMIA
jgi:vacuolar-type H+-ATPase subunit I/STV1